MRQQGEGVGERWKEASKGTQLYEVDWAGSPHCKTPDLTPRSKAGCQVPPTPATEGAGHYSQVGAGAVDVIQTSALTRDWGNWALSVIRRP